MKQREVTTGLYCGSYQVHKTNRLRRFAKRLDAAASRQVLAAVQFLGAG
jgi:hypothetical protein